MKTTQILSALFLLSGSFTASAAPSAQQIPSEVESQAQEIEAKFNSVMASECASRFCTPVGCEVTGFKTLDEKQNSSLPGLDESNEVTSDLQYKLSSLRCEYAYEPTLSAEAVTDLNQRLSDKVRSAGIAMNVQGRKLRAPNEALRQAEVKPILPGATVAPENPMLKAFASALPNLLLALAIFGGLFALIWAARRLGKPKPLAPVIEVAAADEAEVASTEPTAFALVNKKERIMENLASNPTLAAEALEPFIARGDVNEICRVLQQFGPAPLSYFARKADNRELFAAVHKRFEETNDEPSGKELWNFYEKLERLIALAQLGRPEGVLKDEFAFLSDLAPDEFSALIAGLPQDELLAVLSFVPNTLRNQFLQSRDSAFISAYTEHLLRYPRLSEQMLKRLAKQMHEQYIARHSEIKQISRDQQSQIEQLLNSLNGNQQGQLFTGLKKQNPVLFNHLISEIPLDRAVSQMSESVLNDVFLTLNPDEAAAYLRTHPDREAILAKLKAPVARGIEARMQAQPKQFGLALDFDEDHDTQAARERVTDILKTKSTRGEVNLRRINESVLQNL